MDTTLNPTERSTHGRARLKGASKVKDKLGLKAILGAIAAVLILLFGARFIYNIMTFEETDDAQIAAHTSVLSARVGGLVQSVKIDENQKVHAGEVLVQIDPRDYQAALRQAQGELGFAQAALHDSEKNYHRMHSLVKQGAISRQQYDSAEARYQEDQRRVAADQAKVDQASLNLNYTDIKAPVNGTIGKKSVEPGMVVTPGQALFAFVESNDRWVTANFKETQLRDMKIGQPVDVTVDAIADKTFTGHVDSFAPGSGSAFALIPPDNATGNFTKIVQRVPVKIVLDPSSTHGYEDRLVPGISAEVSVRVRK